MPVLYELRDDIAVITLDRVARGICEPSMNAANQL
jgi:hypothetical protein